MPLISHFGDVADKLFRPVTFNFLVPFVPGGVLIIGLAVIFREQLTLLSALPRVFGDATPEIGTVFAAYVAGILLLYVVNRFAHFCGWMLGYSMGSKIGGFRLEDHPSRNGTWRTTAALFLGPALAPRMEREMDRELFKKMDGDHRPNR